MYLRKILTMKCTLQWRDQDFPGEAGGGGTPTPEFGVEAYYSCQKLHENERNWTERGHASLVSAGSANDILVQFKF